ncbi:MFS transporter [Microbacterium betulae]|uniref:MFS transporter n=1 Tax=Microbacterium betulae TaxID=2981139 RepID=A0AA97I6V6_9MICO|nr:MFS transporter [Microbacterium sp. AB]WOF23562.1 MFS transporter [Microbacterium sp. AB]
MTSTAAGPRQRADAENAPTRRLSVAMWCAGVATFALLHAPQGLLTFIAADTGRSAAAVAWVVSGVTLGLALSLPVWAVLAGRIGIAWSMRVSALSSALVALLLPFAPTLEALVAGRVLQGAAIGGIPALAVAMVHERLSGRLAGVIAGGYIAAASVGGLAGRVVAPVLADLGGWRSGLLVLDALGAAVTITMAVLLPRTEPSRTPARRTLRTFVAQLRDRRLRALFLMGGVLLGAMLGMYNAITFRLEAPPYALPAAVVSFVFLAYLGGTAAAQLSGRLTARFGLRTPLLAGCALMLAGALLTWAIPLPLVVAGVVLVTTGMFLAHSVASSAVAGIAGPDRASAGSMYNVFYYAGSSLFGWLCSAAWSAFGWPAVVAVLSGLAIAAAACALSATAPGRQPRAL